MPVFAQFNFNDVDTTALDDALGNGAQLGTYRNGATAVGGQAVLDGQDDIVKIYPDDSYQMDRGTLDIQFTLGSDPLTGTQTVLSRDSTGTTDGGYHIDILADGSVVISHETATGTETFGTAPGFAAPGDEIKLSYSWDQGGAGGVLQIDNLTTDASFEDTVPNTLTMDMGENSQPWIIGGGQSQSDPGQLNNIDQHFAGSVEVFQLSDTVDNLTTPDANPDTATTNEDTPVVIAVLTNDTDPNGDPLTVTTATAPNGSVTINADGTLNYTPVANFNGTDTITYTITDPAGHQASSTVAVTVNPINDAPVAENDSTATAFNTAVIIAPLVNDSDVDGDTLAITGTPTSADGTVVVNGDGTLTFTPNAGFTGVATIDYAITDPSGLTDTATISVTVGEDTARDGIVSGTTGGDLIDVAYTGDNDGDMVDARDAILPGDAPNDDRILAGAGNDTVLAGAGDDSVEGGTGDDSVRGGAGDDTLFGQAGNDTLLGQSGDDSLLGGDGNDAAYGGTGNDVIDTSGGGTLPLPDQGYPGLYASDTDPTNDLDTVSGGLGDDTIRTGDDADRIFGGYGNDVIDGGFDDDTIDGNQDNDVIVGGEGNDLIDAGQGDDLVYGGYGPNVPDAVNIRDDHGDLLTANGRDDIHGGMGNDTIFGMDDDDTIDGGQGNDLIDGGIDEDLIRGNVGNDTITGGAGADTQSGGNDRDTFLVGNNTDGLGDVIDGNEGGDDYDTLDLRGSGPFVIHYDDNNRENGTVDYLDGTGAITGTLTFTNIENVIPCFTPGTLIATPKGEVAVEFLKAGDRVITRDNGIQEIRWTGRKDLGWHELVANPHLKPVMIRQGSLGNGLPEQDMMVSPNHRVLVANDRTALYFDEHEVLVSAKHLVAGRGIDAVDAHGTCYVHFMFDRHEVVLSNGAWTESFQPGDYTLKGMGNAQRGEIFDLFPELKTDAGLEGYQSARRTLKRHEALLLVK